MKRLFAAILALMIFVGCSSADGTEAPVAPPTFNAADQGLPSYANNENTPDDLAALDDGDILYIGERFFLTQINQIFMNRERYLGRTIRYEGMFYSMHWEEYTYHFVIRNTHGCCGPDGMIGFDVALGEFDPFPDNTWVEVTGVLDEFEFSEWYNMLIINVTSIVEMPERGLEFIES
ncbi:MAG: hypothetical protein FWE19_04360 [Oscillospiraceae bacterium]|nr:hypothetical protein [Oscillospiraceae bacterium]